MTQEEKLQIKKFLYALKGAVMAMDVDSLSEAALEETKIGLKNLVLDVVPEPMPQVQADLTVTDPDSPAFVKGILRVDVATKPVDLFPLPDWAERVVYLGGIPFIQDVGNLAIYPYNGINETQEKDMLAYARLSTGAGLSELICFYGHCADVFSDGASGIAIVTFNEKPYCVSIEQ